MKTSTEGWKIMLRNSSRKRRKKTEREKKEKKNKDARGKLQDVQHSYIQERTEKTEGKKLSKK